MQLPTLLIAAIAPSALATITKTTTITDTRTTTITHIYASSTSVQTSLITSVHTAAEVNCTTSTLDDIVYITVTSTPSAALHTAVSAGSMRLSANSSAAFGAPFPTTALSSPTETDASTASRAPVTPSVQGAGPNSAGSLSMARLNLALSTLLTVGTAWILC